VLPLGPVRQYAEQPSDEPITLVAYPGASGTSTLYEDDGLSFDHRTGEWMRIAMAWDDASRQLSLSLAGGRMLPLLSRRIRVRMAGSTDTREVVFTGEPVSVVLA
jgi:hypothetical protein